MNVSDALTLVNVVATGAIAVFVFVGSRQFASLQAQREIRSAWITVDLGIAADKDLLRVSEALMHSNDQEALSEDEQRRRWICYMIRNPLENFQMALLNKRILSMRRAHVCRDPAFASLNACLQQLVHDDRFMKVVRDFSADPRFERLCRNLRDEVICQHPRHASPGDSCSRKCLAARKSLAAATRTFG